MKVTTLMTVITDIYLMLIRYQVPPLTIYTYKLLFSTKLSTILKFSLFPYALDMDRHLIEFWDERASTIVYINLFTFRGKNSKDQLILW